MVMAERESLLVSGIVLYYHGNVAVYMYITMYVCILKWVNGLEWCFLIL